MLAANSVIRNIDMHSKNWYIYRDTGRSGEWAILPWDLDLSHGRVWNPQDTYFDNAALHRRLRGDRDLDPAGGPPLRQPSPRAP
jgi:spore coat protein CotH